MRIVDVSAFYSPEGGGVRTYVDRKLIALPAMGVETVVIVPARRAMVEERGPLARIVGVESPGFPLDRRYRYFNDEDQLHAAIAAAAPDVLEASSPWSSASMVARYPGDVPRALVMHADPLSAYAYRYLDPLMPRDWIDRGFDLFWQHLRRLDAAYDLVVCASNSLSSRLRDGGLERVATIPMGVEPGVFSPALRDEALRIALLDRCDLGPAATLLIGAGRLSKEKRWPLVVNGVLGAGVQREVGLVLVGDGRDRARVVRAVGGNPHIQLLAPTRDRPQLARLLASADALVHGCEAETFGMVPAEARASGLPIIVPDEGGAADQLPGAEGRSYRAANAASLARAILDLIDDGMVAARQRAANIAAQMTTMDDHFAALAARYRTLAAGRPLAA